MIQINNRRYTGSKFKLADWIVDLIGKHCTGKTFFEIFAGTSIISSRIATQKKVLILNDTLEANYIIYKAFYSKGKFDNKKLENLKDNFNNFSITNKNDYFSENYSNKYFSLNDCRKIEKIRNTIEKNKKYLTKKEYAVLLASLIYSMDRCANTVGHFDAYIHTKKVMDKFSFDLIEPLVLPKTKVIIYKEDANILAKKVIADIVYIDPPYNSRQYCQFYHIYETIVRWDKPELFGIALKPKGLHLSDYCRTKAPIVFNDLIINLNCKYIVVSYNNTYESKSNSSRNKIRLNEIKSILAKRGRVKTFSRRHQYFNAGKTNFPDHKEYLFIVKVK